MIKLYTGVLPKKLVDEIQASGLLEREKMSFFPKEEGLEIRFSEVKEVYTDILEGDEVVDKVLSGYEKQVSAQVTIPATEEEPEKVETVTEYIDYTAEFKALLADIQVIVDAHDPTDVEQPKTQLEVLQEVVDQLLIESLGGE